MSYINAYMESRKMVLKNLFAGQQWRRRYRGHVCGGYEGAGGTKGESSVETYTPTYEK